ncbi:hypothetical protein D1825_04700 [Cellulomonas rhizosphaerae]|uniref:Uncharacterized protein n=1 Tax=Cellulomonas rhizosphaerae TaxID=2293719 RepID=A0A413RPD5_9CELL|nr:hypothetical protein D1825_04700 [Cellulomonas rhizosphaerae]
MAAWRPVGARVAPASLPSPADALRRLVGPARRTLGDGPVLALMARPGQDGSANQTTVSP